MTIMLKVLIYCGLAAGCVCIASANMLGDGRWDVLNIEKCDGWEQYEIEADVERRKLNRTHDMFNAYFDTKRHTIDDTYACQLDVCKWVDGGCKPYQVIVDESFERFAKKYAESNVVKALGIAGLDPPDFPIPAGKISFEKYVFDYAELPIQGPYGKYSADAFLIKDSVKLCCLRLTLEFTELPEDDDKK